MIFADRTQAGKKLAEILANDPDIQDNRKDVVVLSLIRGGAPVGYEIAKKIKCPHYPLIVKKIVAPDQEELAIGAVCDGEIFLNTKLIQSGNYLQSAIDEQIKKAKLKEQNYKKIFGSDDLNLEKKIAIVADDGVATGASTIASGLAVKRKGAERAILAVPVAPTNFNPQDASLFDLEETPYDKAIILHKDSIFRTVGQFYRSFEQLSNKQALQYFAK